MRIIQMFSALFGGAAVCLACFAAEAANSRVALVIGESAYADGALPTTANDAGLVAQVLQAAGFDVVGARDLDQKGLRQALRDFLDRAGQAGPDAQTFVYFSGRALQYEGDNYLVPVDARIARDSDAPIEAVKLSDYTHALAAAPGLARIVVVDGARPNPYAQQGSPLAGGLALVDPEPGSVIAFNAAPGAVGVQDAGDYGVYAKTLAGLLRQGGVDISEVFSQTRIAVNQATQGAQIPWSAGKLKEPYYLFERAADAPPPKRIALPKKPLKQLSAEEAYQVAIERDSLGGYQEYLRDFPRAEEARRIEAILAARREALFWRRAVRANTPRGYWTYLARYPKGPHSWDADRRLDVLAARREPPPDFEVEDYEDLPPPPRAEIVYADRPYYYFGGDDYGPPPPPPPRGFVDYEEDDDWRDLPPPPPPAAAGVLPTLAVAIPLLLAARAYHDKPNRNGVAPASAPPPAPRPMAPPPLPQGVQVNAVPTPAPARAPAPRGPGQVKFAAPTTPAPAPAAPGATPSLRPGLAPQPTPGGASPTPGATPLPTPPATPGGARATPGANPLPTPPATPGGVRATPGANPLPTPPATPGGARATPGATPLPTPPATPGGARATPSATPTSSPALRPALTPQPTPVAPRATTLPTPANTAPPTPAVTRTPRAAPSPAGESAPRALPSPAPARTPEARPRPEAPRAEPTREPPKPAEAPARRTEPRPERTEPPRAAPPPAPVAPRVEPPRPAPQPAPPPRAAEPPRPAPPPAPRAEPPKPAAPAKACGGPGQPRC